MDKELSKVGEAIGAIASGCCILSCQQGEKTNGVLVSWVQQAAFEPPSVTVAIKQGRPAVEILDATKLFALNVLSDSASDLLRHFGKGVSPEENAFASFETDSSEFGPLLTTCVAHMGCEVTDKITVGDHYIYVAKVIAGAAKPGTKPMIHIRRNGLSY